ncbi:MAG: hypothetical protein RL885_10645 [Planctomycetota bacterium]
MSEPPKVGRYRLHVESLVALRHRHDPERCAEVDCCCSTYEVVVGSKEVERIVGYLPLAAKHQPELIEDDELINPFDQVERSLWAIDTDEGGRCRFAYKTRKGETFCSIHSAALEIGVDPFQAKPRSCALWPLAISEGRNPVLSVVDDAYRFPCNKRRRTRRPALDDTVVELATTVFGERFARQLFEACEAYLADR